MEPLLLPSIGNSFIFQCIDGIRIDGKDRGISRSIFKQVMLYFCIEKKLFS